MYSKLIAACMALAAFAAFAVAPSIASASPELTHPTGATLAPGALITGTNVGVTKFTAGGVEVICNSAYMTGELTENSGTSIKGDITAAHFTGTDVEKDCTSGLGAVHPTPETGTNGLPWCLSANSAMNPDEFQVRGNSCNLAARPIRFALDVTGLATCTYERAAAISGSFTTHPEDAILTISEVEFTRVGTNFLCPASGKLDMSFTLETDTETVSPMYIS